ncbi:MAG: DMT family transporter [Clostridia bacterium]|nr:DMT family transporter [Clostridia bacterium]
MKKAKSVILLFLCAIIWGTSFVAQVNSRGLTPFAYTGFKYLLGFMSLIPVVLIFEKGKMSREQRTQTIKAGIVSGVFLTIAANFQQFGIYYETPAGTAGFLTGLYTVLVPVFALIIFKKKTSVTTWIGVFLAVIGLYMLCIKKETGFTFTWGNVLVTIGTVFWALHIISIDHFSKSVENPLKYSFVQFATCAVLTMTCALLFEKINMSDVISTKTEILYGGILSVGVAFTLQTIGQRGIDPALSAIIMSTESVFSVIGGAVLLHEKLDFPYGYLGCIIMFMAIILSQVDKNFFKKFRFSKK